MLLLCLCKIVLTGVYKVSAIVGHNAQVLAISRPYDFLIVISKCLNLNLLN